MTEPLFDLEQEVDPWTEAALLDLLRSRYSTQGGNGPRYAFAAHVRDRAGFNASRTLDAVVMDTWPSSGLALHGFEVKISRADWRRELADPSKAAAFTRWVDYFWIVAPRNVVRDDELPDGWGLLEPRRGSLIAAVSPTRGTPETLDRSFMACVLRAAVSR